MIRSPLIPRARSVGIVGLGFMGSSLGLALRRRGHYVLGWDPKASHAKASLKKGAVAVLAAKASELSVCGTVVLAVPPSAVVPALRSLAPSLEEGTLVLDLASVRRGLGAEGAAYLGRVSTHWIGAHPMTGSERSGPDASRPDLFKGALVILVPPQRVDPTALKRARSFWTTLGSKPRVLDEKTHDKMMALVSHGPHLSAVALTLALKGQGEALDYAGPGFRDSTRVAAGDPDLWADILWRNAPEARLQLGRLRAALGTLEASLKAPSKSGLRRLLQAAALRRRKL